MQYNVGDIMFAISSLKLEDVYGKMYNYHVGDQFIIMSITYMKDYTEFQFNTSDSVFIWSFYPNELKELPDYMIHKREFTKLIRKQKLNKLHEIHR